MRRTSIQSSGGSVTEAGFSGALPIGFNAWIASGTDPLLQVVGRQVSARLWSRDSKDRFTTSRTDAVQLEVRP